MANKQVLVTGASGFVGTAVCSLLVQRGLHVQGVVRKGKTCPAGAQPFLIDDIASMSEACWSRALEGVDVVIHCAGLAHQAATREVAERAAYGQINTEATLKLARAASNAKVKRFIFISTIKVFGESSKTGKPFAFDDIPQPADDYSHSKLDAEKGLEDLGRSSMMNMVVIRPPLVYGPGVGANFEALMKAVRRRVPLPLGAIDNRRSLVSVDNLADLIGACVVTEPPIDRVLLVSDGEDLSTRELVQRIGKAMGVTPLLIPVPSSLLMMVASIIGKRSKMERLCGNLQVDIRATCDTVEWSPPYRMSETLADMV